MFSNRLASHLERGVVGFPTTLASSVGLIMASPVILTVTSGFGMGGDTFALAVLLAFIMMQAQVTTFAEAATLIPTTGSVYDYISCGMGRFFAITGALCAYLIVHIFAGTAETILAGIMALVNFESINAQMAAHQNTWMVGVGMVVIFGLLNAIGVEIFGKVEVVLTFGMWTTLTIFGLCGIFMAPVTHLSGWFGTPLNISDINGLFGYIGMAMFMFVGCELVTPMAPEIKQAHRTIPRAMALGLLGVASYTDGDPGLRRTGDGPRRPVLVGGRAAAGRLRHHQYADGRRAAYYLRHGAGRRAAPFPDLAASAL